MGVAVVVNGSAIDNVEGRGLVALCWVDKEEDLVNSSHKQNFTL